jgi:hypothetical protein
MVRLFQILFVCLVIMLPVGCANKQKEADTKGIKIGDLASTGRRIQPKVLHTTNIEVICYELPADNIASLEGVWKMLNPGTLRYNEPNSFAANGLRAAMGKFTEFQKLTAMLNAANAIKQPTTSLLMADNQPELVGISRIPNKTSISYIGRQGTIRQTETGPGSAGLQIFARQIIDLTVPAGSEKSQMASIHVVPAILASTEGAAPAIADRLKEHDLRIYSAGFSVIMKPGEFILLGPAEYKQDDITATSRFFTKQGPKPAIMVFLLVCVSIF